MVSNERGDDGECFYGGGVVVEVAVVVFWWVAGGKKRGEGEGGDELMKMMIK